MCESHVRLYQHELLCPAYRSLDPDARALLIELRALYRPFSGNLIFCSVREAAERMGVGSTRRASNALAELISRGWISVETPGGFTQKTRHATSYRLENEPTLAPGAAPRKAFMKWKPNAEHEKGR